MSSKIDYATITYAVTTPLGILRRNTAVIDYSYNLNNVGTIFGGTLGDGYYAYTAWIGSKNASQPSTQTSGHLLVLSEATQNQCHQVIFGGSILLIRKYNGTSWSSWTKITGTADS